MNHTALDKKHHIFEIIIDGDERIRITTFKDWVSIKAIEGSPLNHQPGNFVDSVGLMGDFWSGKTLARDGERVIEDPIAFGQEWQVLPWEPKLFTTSRSPQYPARCNIPDPTAEQARRRLGMIVDRSAAEDACANSHGEDAYIGNCVYDGKFAF